jgi:hypothetical protein
VNVLESLRHIETARTTDREICEEDVRGAHVVSESRGREDLRLHLEETELLGSNVDHLGIILLSLGKVMVWSRRGRGNREALDRVVSGQLEAAEQSPGGEKGEGEASEAEP